MTLQKIFLLLMAMMALLIQMRQEQQRQPAPAPVAQTDQHNDAPRKSEGVGRHTR